MDDLDRALARAWERIHRELAENPHEHAKRLARHAQRTYQRPLRSWSLALRANDARIAQRCASRVIAYHTWDDDQPDAAIEAVRITGADLRALCPPLTIPYPGMLLDEAARAFGVNRTTIHRWAKAGRVRMDRYCKRNGTDLHRADKYIWTPEPVDPNGEVWCGPWGTLRTLIAKNVPHEWEQTIERTHRALSEKSVVNFLRCPECARWVYKLFRPMPIWTMGPCACTTPDDRFLCNRCARLVYESAERASRPSAGRTVDAWDRFIRRLSGGTLRGREVELPDASGTHQAAPDCGFW